MIILFILLLLVFLGYGFSVILIPEKNQKFSLVLSPFIGSIIIIIIGLALSVAKIGMNQELFSGGGLIGFKGYQLVLLTSLTWLYAIIFHKKRVFRYYSQSLYIIPLALLIVLVGFFNFSDQLSSLSLSTELQKSSIIEMIYHSGQSLSKVNLQLGTPILYSFFLSFFYWVPKDELLKTIGISQLLIFGIFTLVILLIKSFNSSLKIFEFNGTIVLASAAIFSLSLLNVKVFLITFIFMAIYFLFQSYLHRTLLLMFTFIKIVLLMILINPFFIGLLIQIHLYS